MSSFHTAFLQVRTFSQKSRLRLACGLVLAYTRFMDESEFFAKLRSLGWSGCMHDSDCACTPRTQLNDFRILESVQPVRGKRLRELRARLDYFLVRQLEKIDERRYDWHTGDPMRLQDVVLWKLCQSRISFVKHWAQRRWGV